LLAIVNPAHVKAQPFEGPPPDFRVIAEPHVQRVGIAVVGAAGVVPRGLIPKVRPVIAVQEPNIRHKADFVLVLGGNINPCADSYQRPVRPRAGADPYIAFVFHGVTGNGLQGHQNHIHTAAKVKLGERSGGA